MDKKTLLLIGAAVIGYFMLVKRPSVVMLPEGSGYVALQDPNAALVPIVLPSIGNLSALESGARIWMSDIGTYVASYDNPNIPSQYARAGGIMEGAFTTRGWSGTGWYSQGLSV